MKILASVARNPKTISAVARELKQHPANITHHFKTLLAAKLIRLVEERSVGRNVEKFYLAVAQSFEVRQEKGALKSAKARVLQALRDDLGAGIAQLEKENLPVVGYVANISIQRERFMEFADRLQELVKDFEKAESTQGEPYSLNLSLYPRR